MQGINKAVVPTIMKNAKIWPLVLNLRVIQTLKIFENSVCYHFYFYFFCMSAEFEIILFHFG